jgi:hypothetical protein
MIFDFYINNSAVNFVQRKSHREGSWFGISCKNIKQSFLFIETLFKKRRIFGLENQWRVKILVEDMKTEEPKIYIMDSLFNSSEVEAYLDAKNQYYILGAHTGRKQLNICKVCPKIVSY